MRPDTIKVFAALGLICLALQTGTPAFAKDGPQVAEKEKEEPKKEDKEEACQSNPFTRFWIHTVGAPMARGMKDGTKKVYKGLKTGSCKIKDGFTGGSKDNENDEDDGDAKD